jgi:hypothetical protein
VNRLKDLRLKKGLDNLNALRQRAVAVTERLADFQAELLNVHVDFPLFQRLARPVTVGRSTIPGIKIHDTRMMRLMEVFLHGGPQLAGTFGRPFSKPSVCRPTRIRQPNFGTTSAK